MKNLFVKCHANKLLSGLDIAKCWFCQNPTQYAMTEKDGCEIWCCESCLWKQGKLKRFKSRMVKYATQPKKTQKIQNSTRKNQGNQVIWGYSGGSKFGSEK